MSPFSQCPLLSGLRTQASTIRPEQINAQISKTNRPFDIAKLTAIPLERVANPSNG
jgi:hypothetical protein